MAKKKIRAKYISLKGNRYRLERPENLKGAFGDCSHPNKANRTIRVVSGLRGKKELEILIHEMLHACFWDLSEESIRESSKDIMEVLWKLGYRKNKNK